MAAYLTARAARTVLALALCAAAGCDQLPWAGNASKSAVPASAPSAFPPAPPVTAAETIAKVNGVSLSTHDLELVLEEARANIEAAGGQWKPLATQDNPNDYDLPDALNELVTMELRAKDALARGLDRQPDVQRRLSYLIRSFLAQEWIRSQLERVAPTQEEISQFYAENKAGFRDPDRIKVRQFVTDSEDKAKAALVKLLEGVDFVALAQQMSLQPEAAQSPLADKWVLRSGEKAAFAPDDDTVREFVDPTLEQAVFSIDKEGGLSHYVKAGDGRYHIFQLVKREFGRQRELVDVSDGIRAHLQYQKLGELTDALRAKAAIEPFPERLETVAQPSASQ